MNPAIRWGLGLGVAVGALGFVMAIVGVHTAPLGPLIFVLLATALNIGAVVMALRATAATTAWGGQLLNGLLLGVMASVIIFVSSWLMTAVVFPDYFAEMRATIAEALAAANVPAAQAEVQLAQFDASATPVGSALQGVMGTMITSALVAVIAGVFLRKKSD